MSIESRFENFMKAVEEALEVQLRIADKIKGDQLIQRSDAHLLYRARNKCIGYRNLLVEEINNAG